MKISITECYTEPGASYNFSWESKRWILKELKKRVKPSESFLQTYSKDYGLALWLNAHSKSPKPRISGPTIRRRDKEVEFFVSIPHTGRKAKWPRDYARALRHLLDSAVMIFQKLGIDASRAVEDSPALVEQFASMPEEKMIYKDWDDDDYDWKPTGSSKADGTARPRAKAKSQSRTKTRKRNLPKWTIPKKLKKLVEDCDGTWEDERWDPILLTVMSDTLFEERDIPLTWQIEFDPFDDRLEGANERIEATGIEPDGDGWSEVIEKEFRRRHTKLAGEFHSDSESSTCVIWVESEKACQKLIEVVWSIMNPASTAAA